MSNREHNSSLFLEPMEKVPIDSVTAKVLTKEGEEKEKKEKKKVKKKKSEYRKRVNRIEMTPGWHCELRKGKVGSSASEDKEENMYVWSVYVTQEYERIESISEYHGSASIDELVENNRDAYPDLQQTTTLKPGSSIFIRVLSSSKGVVPASSSRCSSRIGEQYQADIPSLKSSKDQEDENDNDYAVRLKESSAEMNLLLHSEAKETKTSRRDLFAFYDALKRHGKHFTKIQEDLKLKSVSSCVDFYYRIFKLSDLYKQWKSESKQLKAKPRVLKTKPRVSIPRNFLKPLLASHTMTKRTTKPNGKRKRRYIRVNLPSLDEAIVMVQDNPKRPSSLSFSRYEKYKAAQTLKEFYALGGRKKDARYDLGRGYMIVTSRLNQIQETVKKDEKTSSLLSSSSSLSPSSSFAHSNIAKDIVENKNSDDKVQCIMYERTSAGCDKIFNKWGGPWTVHDGKESYRRNIRTGMLEKYGGAVVTARKSNGPPAPSRKLNLATTKTTTKTTSPVKNKDDELKKPSSLMRIYSFEFEDLVEDVKQEKWTPSIGDKVYVKDDDSRLRVGNVKSFVREIGKEEKIEIVFQNRTQGKDQTLVVVSPIQIIGHPSSIIGLKTKRSGVYGTVTFYDPYQSLYNVTNCDGNSIRIPWSELRRILCSKRLSDKMKLEDYARSLIGKTIHKLFPGYGLFAGTVSGVRVVDIANNELAVYFEIVYPDGDKEELEVLELMNSLYETCLQDQSETMKIATESTLALLCTFFPSFCPMISSIKNGRKRKYKKSNERKKKKIKKKKEGPKRFTSYTLFMKEKFPKLRAEQPSKTSRELFKILAEKWKLIDKLEKDKFNEKATKANRLALEEFEKKRTTGGVEKNDSSSVSVVNLSFLGSSSSSS